MLKSLLKISICFLAFVAVEASASQSLANKYIKNAKPVGTGDLHFLFWKVYDVVLYAPEGEYQPSSPYALKIIYDMDFDSADIAKRSVEEMKKQGFNDSAKLNEWQKKMAEVFPDVEKGSSITGIRDSKGNAVFYHNGEKTGVIEDSEFSESFFAIWLDEKTSEPSLRREILSLNDR